MGDSSGFPGRKKPTADRFYYLLPALFLGVSLISVPGLAAGEEPAAAATLTVEETVARGMQLPALEDILQRELAIARARVKEERLWPNPILSYARENTSASIEDFAWVEQELTVSGSRGIRVAAAERLVSAARHTTNRQRDLRAARIRWEFYSVLHAQERVAVTREWSRQLDAAVDAVALREAAGDVSAYDLRRVERELRNAESQLATERAAQEQAWARLGPLVGIKPEAQGDWPAVVGTLLPPVELPSLDELESALDSRADLQALAEEARAAELAGRAAARGWVPPIALGAGTKTVDEGGDRDTGFIVTASVPIPVFRRQQPERTRAESEARYSRGQLQLRRSESAASLRSMWRNVNRLSEAARRFATSTGDASAQLVRSAEAAYRGGEIGILELVDAYRAHLDDGLRRLELESEARRARINLDSTAGGGSQP